MTQIGKLVSLRPEHTYYGGLCRDFEFVIPSDTAELLARHKHIAKVVDDTLYVVYEASGTNTPAISLLGKFLRFGLRLRNPYFSNVTTIPQNIAGKIGVMIMLDQELLSNASFAPLVGRTFRHTITDTARPVTVTLYGTRPGAAVTQTIMAVEQTDVLLDIGDGGYGYTYVQEQFPLTTNNANAYYIHPELHQAGVLYVIDLEIDPSMYGDGGWDFPVSFTAKSEILRYFVVLKNYSVDDFNNLAITDGGFTGDGRPQVHFARIPPAEQTQDDKDIITSLTGGGTQIALFKSCSLPLPPPPPAVPVATPRRAAGRKGIRLHIGGNDLVSNLPSPGPEKADAHMIIHLSKP